jgi:YggT family protein
MLNSFIQLVLNLLNLYLWCVIIQAVVQTLISFKIINGFQPLVQKIMYALNRIVEPALSRIRKLLPDLGGIDISPIILILLINFAMGIIANFGRSF